MKRKILASAVLLFVFFSGIVTAGAVNGTYDGYSVIRIFSGGKELKPDKTPAILYKGTSLVPIGVLRQLGVKVEWNGPQQRVDVSLPVRTVPILTAEQLESFSKYAYKVTTAPIEGHPNGKQGSGFIIDGHFVTAAHVGADADYVQVQVDGQWQKTSTYAFTNAVIDIMGFAFTGGKSLPYSTELPQEGDIIYSVGFPGNKLTITEGEVYGITTGPNNIVQISHSAKTEPGSSGGLLIDGRGQVIGMNDSAFTYNGVEGNFATPISYVLDEIEKSK